MKRSRFLRLSAAAGLAAALHPAPLRAAGASSSGASSDPSFGAPPAGGSAPLLTILHTNDTHARHEPFPAESFAHPGLGGALRRARLIDAIRLEPQPVLLFDAGDLFQGTPWFTAFRGRLEMEMMRAMGYDAVALGNHEFDLGVSELASALRVHPLPMVCANYELSDTPLASHIRKYRVVTAPNGLRVGVFGLGIDLEGLIPAADRAGVLMRDPYLWASSMVRILRGFQGCDLVVCLSHLGLRPDRAQNADPTVSPTPPSSTPPHHTPPDDTSLVENVAGLDLVIGGHTHTFLDAPVIRVDPAGRPVPIVQAGHGGIRLGRFDLFPSPGLPAAARDGLFSRFARRRAAGSGTVEPHHPPVPSYRWRQYEIADPIRELS